MSKRLRTVIVAVSVVASVLGGAWSPAIAGGIYRTDGNDTAGPLDLASMRLTPISGGDRFQIRTRGTFTSGQLNGDDGWFEVDFDTNADRKYDFWAVVFYAKGKLLAIEGQGKSALRKLAVRRVDAKTVSFDIAHRNLGNVSSYDFVVYSIWRGKPCSTSKVCVDTIPNTYPLIRHDFTPPTVTFKKDVVYASDVSPSLQASVSFTVKDDRYGSGVRNWQLERRPFGTGLWSVVKTGSAGSPAVAVAGLEGVGYELRALAWDRQGNKGANRSPLPVLAFPYDDTNVALSYSAGWAMSTGVTDAFLGTTASGGKDETITLEVPPYEQVCVVGGASTGGDATATIDGLYTTPTLTETTSTPARTRMSCATSISGFTQIATIHVTSDVPFVVDAVYV